MRESTIHGRLTNRDFSNDCEATIVTDSEVESNDKRAGRSEISSSLTVNDKAGNKKVHSHDI